MLEECSAAPGNVIAEGVQNLGAKVRRFLRSCDDFEGENQGKSEGGNIKDKEDRANVYVDRQYYRIAMAALYRQTSSVRR